MLRTLTLAGLLVVTVSVSGCDLNGYGTKLEFEGNELYYTEGVTEAEAQKLGEFLVKIEFLDNTRKRSVQLCKDGDMYQFRMVVVDDYKSRKDVYPNGFRALATMISEKVFDGGKVEFHLCDNKLKTIEVLQQLDLGKPARAKRELSATKRR